MKEEAKTYEELIRKKRCIDITKYYELDENDLETIYTFLKENPAGVVRGGSENLVLTCKGKENQVIVSRKKSSTIDGLIVSNKLFKIIPHYTPSIGGGYSSGGSSSNNNNNNNNNNN